MEANKTNAPEKVTDAKPSTPPKTKKVGNKKKKKLKKWIILGVILVVLAVVFFVLKPKTAGAESENAQTTFTVTRRDVTRVLTGTGTLQPNDSYNVTALTSGEIMEDYFEEGDIVAKDQLLMVIDSSKLDSSLERAENTYENTADSLSDLYDTQGDLIVTSDYTGVILAMDIDVGDDVKAGQQIATVVDRETMLIDIPFMQSDAFSINKGDTATVTTASTLESLTGTVTKIASGYDVNQNGVKTMDVTIAVANPGGITESTEATAKIGAFSCTASGKFYYNVNEVITSDGTGEVTAIYKDKGDSIAKGETVLVLKNDDLDDQISQTQKSLKEASNSLNDARDAYDDYQLKAPIAGTVIEKNYKKGEKIGQSSSGSNIIAVIYDLSSLKFEMSIDELDIDDIKLGQEVNITSDAHTGESYVGYVTQISVAGTTSNGTTTYPITVTVEDYGTEEEENMLKPGMNIDAEIVLEKEENALVVPVGAIGRGNTVKVVSADSVQSADSAKEQKTGSTENTDKPQMPDGENGEMPQMPEGADGEMPQMPDGENSELPQMPSGKSSYGTVASDAAYETVTVTTGISDESYIVILDGLEEGDVVIVEQASASDSEDMFMMGGMGMGGMSGGPGGGMGGGPGGGGMGGGPGF